jgi:uridine kinase
MFILRGLPGSGKSTLARKITEKYQESNEVAICSGDDYFTDKSTGQYNFDISKLKNAHEFARTKAEDSCRSYIYMYI